MKTTSPILAACAFGLLAVGGARAQDKQTVYCVAVRTLPSVDQDGFALGDRGPIFQTQNFTSDLTLDQLSAAWRAYIIAKHPITYGGNPDDTCHMASERRAFAVGVGGVVRNVSLGWVPKAPTP